MSGSSDGSRLIIVFCQQVYRSVLLNSRQRHTSGSSDGSRAEASGTMSPVNMDKEEGKEKSKFAQV